MLPTPSEAGRSEGISSPSTLSKLGRSQCPPGEEGEPQALPRRMLAWLFPRTRIWGAGWGHCWAPHPVVMSPQTGQEPMCWRKPLGQGWGSARKGEQAQRSGGSQQPQGPHCAQKGPGWGVPPLPEPPTVGCGRVSHAGSLNPSLSQPGSWGSGLWGSVPRGHG